VQVDGVRGQGDARRPEYEHGVLPDDGCRSQRC
jgi:hypothetical protein